MSEFLPEDFTFKTIVDGSPYPVYLCIGEDMIIAYANAATLRTWGKTDSVLGKPFIEAIPEIKNQPFNQLLLDVYHTGIPHFSTDKRADLVVDNQLQTFFFKFSYQPYRNLSGEIIGVFCMATDVSELVSNRERLIASEESLRMAIDAAELGTFDKDLVKGKIYWDPRCRELFNINHDNEVWKYQ
ncbi:PAS domain-containing protein [Pedobacter insulae]|uniref:PAS fold-containing protein n=1 Tax=Pedobacter insulae TaxID=414048 RepID=A0A1I2ZS07_9SPHI|nr:PAS domain-containing protein [Pedobacter insulae]SFH39871.1 PAS fold-containing protein [Pedobacter insulae]